MKPNILIAVPSYRGDVKAGTMTSIVSVTHALQASGIPYSLRPITSMPIDDARSIFLSQLLAEPEFSHVFFSDDDMIYRASAFKRMLEAAKPVVGIVCPRKRLDLSRAIAEAKTNDTEVAIARASSFNCEPLNTDQTSPLHLMKWIGTAIMLIERSVPERLAATGKIRSIAQHPWATKGLNGTFYGFFDKILDPHSSEDVSFCRRWSELCNGELWAIADEPVGHRGEFTYRAKYLDRA